MSLLALTRITFRPLTAPSGNSFLRFRPTLLGSQSRVPAEETLATFRPTELSLDQNVPSWMDFIRQYVPSRWTCLKLFVAGSFAVLVYVQRKALCKDFTESTLYRRVSNGLHHWWNFSGTVSLNSGCRRLFQRNLWNVKVGISATHAHGQAARERNSATLMMINTVVACGMEPYVISPSPREKQYKASRVMYSYADLNQKFRQDPITDRTCFVLTDADYYVDMPALLSYGRPVIMYTFCPQNAAGLVKDGYYRIENDEIVYAINGGKREYRHPVWNWNMDIIGTEDVATSWYTLLWKCWRTLWHPVMIHFGFNPQVWGTVSHVDQFEMSDHRRIICVVPFARTYISKLSGTMLGRCTFRVKVGDEPHVGVVYNKAGSNSGEVVPMISLAKEGELATAEMPLSKFQGVLAAHQCANSKHLSDTQRRSSLDTNESAILHRYILNSDLPDRNIVVNHNPGKAKHYTMVNKVDTPAQQCEEPREYARSFAPPAISCEAVYPTEGLANTIGGIEGRVLAPQAASIARITNTIKGKPSDGVAPIVFTRLARYAHDFVLQLVPDELAGTGVPLSVQEIDDRQDRPTQRLRSSQRTMTTSEPFVVRAFQKREAYAAANDPRNISTVPTMHTLRLSGFTYAFKETILKKQHWYTPCRTPNEIAAQLSDIAMQCESVVETDFSRFDGHINEWTRRTVEFAAYLRWCDNGSRGELGELLENEINAHATTSAGKYSPLGSRLSGSPGTTDGNTMIDFFVYYVAHREDHPLKTPEEAFAHCAGSVACCGDDGLADGAIASDRALIRAATSLGLSLKIESRSRRGEPISYLSRVFPDIWTSPASHQSALRALGKINSTTNVTHELAEMGVAKTLGYLVTDAKTPFIGDWCRCYLRSLRRDLAVVDLTNDEAMRQRYGDHDMIDDLPWWAKRQADRASPWPQEGMDFLPTVAKQLDVSIGELEDHIELLKQYDGPVDGMPTLQMPERPVKVDAVVDGEVHVAGPSANSAVADSSATNPALSTPQDDNAVPEPAKRTTATPSGPNLTPKRAKKATATKVPNLGGARAPNSKRGGGNGPDGVHGKSPRRGDGGNHSATTKSRPAAKHRAELNGPG